MNYTEMLVKNGFESSLVLFSPGLKCAVRVGPCNYGDDDLVVVDVSALPGVKHLYLRPEDGMEHEPSEMFWFDTLRAFVRRVAGDKAEIIRRPAEGHRGDAGGFDVDVRRKGAVV